MHVDGLAHLLAQILDVGAANLDGQLVVDGRDHVAADALDHDVGVQVAVAQRGVALLVERLEVELERVVDLGAHQVLVERRGHGALAQADQTLGLVHARHQVAVGAHRDLDLHVLAHLGLMVGVVDVLEVVVVVLQLGQLLGDLGLGGLLGGHLDGDRIVARQLHDRGDLARHREAERLARLDRLVDVELRLVDVDHVGAVDGRHRQIVDELLGDARHGVGVAADLLLEDLARGLALAEARNVALGDVGEKLVGRRVDLLGRSDQRQDELLAVAVVLAHDVFNLHCAAPPDVP